MLPCKVGQCARLDVRKHFAKSRDRLRVHVLHGMKGSGELLDRTRKPADGGAPRWLVRRGWDCRRRWSPLQRSGRLQLRGCWRKQVPA
jgi:hypothetical protein